MGTLFVDRSGASLKQERKALVVCEREGRHTRIPVALLERVVLACNVSLDSGVLAFLADEGVSVVMLSGRGRERLAVVHGRQHNEVRRRVAQYRTFSDPEARVAWSSRLIAHKLAAQQRTLCRIMRARPDLRHGLKAATASLAERREQVRVSLHTAAIRGIEGAGAAVYFNALTQAFPSTLGFHGRNRRPPRDPVNAVLSLGYTLLHAEAVQACHAAGLDPLFGFFHETSYARESLAADLIEPFRPRVDQFAWALFRDQTLRSGQFSIQGEACLLDKAGRSIFYPQYEAAIKPVRRAMRRLTRRLSEILVRQSPATGGGWVP